MRVKNCQSRRPNHLLDINQASDQPIGNSPHERYLLDGNDTFLMRPKRCPSPGGGQRKQRDLFGYQSGYAVATPLWGVRTRKGHRPVATTRIRETFERPIIE